MVISSQVSRSTKSERGDGNIYRRRAEKIMKIVFQILLAFALTFALGAVTAAAQRSERPRNKIRASPKRQTGSRVVYEPDKDLLVEMSRKVVVALANNDWARFDRQRPINNRSGTRSAYIAQYPLKPTVASELPENLYNVIVVHDAAKDKFYKILGFDDFPWRPFSEIKWTSQDVLEFEQWINPNNGGRYAVNVKTGKIVAAGYVRND